MGQGGEKGEGVPPESQDGMLGIASSGGWGDKEGGRGPRVQAPAPRFPRAFTQVTAKVSARGAACVCE